MKTADNITIRRADEADSGALERLATLDSGRAFSGDVLIAAVDHEPQAAIEIATGATVADPFRPTAHLIDLLSVRAARLREQKRSPRRLRLRLRPTYRTA
jgi:hypothetical protein